MNLRSGQPSHRKELVEADFNSFAHVLNEVLPTYIFNCPLEICYSFHKKTFIKDVGTVQYKSEKVALCNLKVDLWEAAVHSVIRDTSEDRCPDFIAVQTILNYVLCEHKCTDFRLASEALSRLLYFHSPAKKEMRKYYLHILQDQFTTVETNSLEGNQGFLNVLIDTMHDISIDTLDYTVFSTYPPPPETARTSYTADFLNQLQGKNKSIQSDISLDSKEKLKRTIFCLNFACDIFEQNLIDWMRENGGVLQKKPSNPSLLESFIWPDLRNKGHITPFIQRLIALQKRAVTRENVLNHSFERLITLTAEVLRANDRLVVDMYPFIGKLSWDLARELALLVIDEINHGNDTGAVDYLTRLKPSWLRMIVTSRVLGDMVGFHCDPELRSVITVMENLEQIYNLDHQENLQRESKADIPADPILVARFKRLKSVNGLFRTGLSRLHTACKVNNVAEVRALLTFPYLDLNLKDDLGWTSLHRAVMKGSQDCVRELLDYAPKINQIQRRIDTRARGPGGVTPLMLAVQGNHAQICSLLLQHTGSVLLEDINDDNDTALNLCKDEIVRKELMPYKLKNIITINSKKEVKFSTGNLLLVAKVASNLLLSYFVVYRTWDVYLGVKKYASSKTKRSANPKLIHNYDFKRYHRDFRTNIAKLRQMVRVLMKFKDLSPVYDILYSIVSSNKN